MPNWWPTNSPEATSGAFAWDWADRGVYPDLLPSFPFVMGWARENDLAGDGWESVYRVIDDLTIVVPPEQTTIKGSLQYTNWSIQLWHYPMDEVPAEYQSAPLGPRDRIEIWTGAGRTGTKLTEQAADYSGALPANSYIVDYASGTIRFSTDLENDSLYVTYFGLQGAMRPSYVNYLQDNVWAIADALLNGLVHGLQFEYSYTGGDVKIIDFSGMTGTPDSSDWLIHVGTFGVFPQALGWRGDGTMFVWKVTPALQSGSSVGLVGSAPDAFDQGGFLYLTAYTEFKTNLIKPNGSGDIVVELDTDDFVVTGGTDPTDGEVAINTAGTVTIDGIEIGTPSDALVILGATTSSRFKADGSFVTDVPFSLALDEMHGDFTPVIGYDQSNAINAEGWCFHRGLQQRFIGGFIKIKKIWAELESAASEGITNIKIIERDPDVLLVNTLYNSGTIDWSGSYARYSATPGTIVHADRIFGIQITCANSVANAVKIANLWVDIVLEVTAT